MMPGDDAWRARQRLISDAWRRAAVHVSVRAAEEHSGDKLAEHAWAPQAFYREGQTDGVPLSHSSGRDTRHVRSGLGDRSK